MLPKLNCIHDSTLSMLSGFPLQREQRPPMFEAQRSADGQGSLCSTGLKIGDIARFRVARLKCPGLDCLSVLLLPQNPKVAPLFASQWVLTGTILRVLFIDVEWLIDNNSGWNATRQALAKHSKAWQAMSAPVELPPWLTMSQGPQVLFGSVKNPCWETLSAIYEDYFQFSLKFMKDAPKAKHPSPEIEEVMKSHGKHFPGRPVLNKLFGNDWTEEFLRDWHFGPNHDCLQ